MGIHMISSASNAQVKNIEKLMKSSRERTEQGLYVCEGIKMFLEVMERPGALVKAYFSESFLKEAVWEERIFSNSWCIRQKISAW